MTDPQAHDWQDPSVDVSTPLPWGEDEPTPADWATPAAPTAPTPAPADSLNLPGAALSPEALAPDVRQGFLPASPEQAEEEPEGPAQGWPLLCCAIGPCRHAQRIFQARMPVAQHESVSVFRYCRLLVESTGHGSGTMNLSDLVIRGCDAYAPPWWSLAGWHQRLRFAQMAERDERKYTGTVTPLWQALGWISRRVLHRPYKPGRLDLNDESQPTPSSPTSASTPTSVPPIYEEF